MRKLLVLLSVLSLLLSSAQALTLPYAEDTVLSVLSLTDAQRSLADFLYTPVFNGQERIELPKGTRYADVSAAMTTLMQDYPELFHLDRNYSVGYYTNAPETATYVEPTYRMSAAEAAEIRAVLYAQAYLFADRHRSAEALHDALLERVTYGGATELRHTAVGTLLEGEATCEGYAQGLTLLYRMAGIPCGVVTGTAVDSSGRREAHSWNIANLNGCTLIDATWNDQGSLGLNTHWYFGLSTQQMGTDHFPDADQRIPACGDQANWHRVRGYVISTAAEAEAAMRRLINAGQVNLRITSTTLYHTLARDTYSFLDGYNRQHPQDGFYGAYRIITSDAQQCVILQRTSE